MIMWVVVLATLALLTPLAALITIAILSRFPLSH